jgi:enoyl-CoA hydratase
MTTYSTIEYETSDQIARIWMNRPEVHNAQNERMLAELNTAFAEAAADPEVRVIVLAGRGRSFSSGHDLKRTVEGAAEQDVIELRKTTEGRLQHEYSSYYSHALRIRDVPKPTIAEVRGHCIAAGLMLAAMCDLIVAGRNALFSNPVLRMGALGAEVLVEPWELGVRKAKELLFLGDSLTATEAKDLGLVNRVVDDDELTGAVDAMARRIAGLPPVAAQLMKQSLNATWDAMGQQQAWSYHFMIHQLSHATDEYQKIIAPREGRKLKEFLAARDSASAE